MAALFYLWCNFCDFLWFSPINDVSCSPPLYIPCSLNPYPYCRPIRIRRRRRLSSGHKKRCVLRHIPIQTTGHSLPSTHVCSTPCQHVHYRNSKNLINVARAVARRDIIFFGLWNARSLSNKVASLSDLAVSNSLNILIITETWLKEGKYHSLCSSAICSLIFA